MKKRCLILAMVIVSQGFGYLPVHGRSAGPLRRETRQAPAWKHFWLLGQWHPSAGHGNAVRRKQARKAAGSNGDPGVPAPVVEYGDSAEGGK